MAVAESGPGKKPKKGSDDGLSETARATQQAVRYTDAVWKLIGGAVMGVAGGYFLDKWLGTKPWLLMVGALVGIGLGFYGLITDLIRLGKK